MVVTALPPPLQIYYVNLIIKNPRILEPSDMPDSQHGNYDSHSVVVTLDFQVPFNPFECLSINLMGLIMGIHN